MPCIASTFVKDTRVSTLLSNLKRLVLCEIVEFFSTGAVTEQKMILAVWYWFPNFSDKLIPLKTSFFRVLSSNFYKISFILGKELLNGSFYSSICLLPK